MLTLGTVTSCSDFLDDSPKGVVDQDKAFKLPDDMVNSAYAMLGDCWYSYPFNLWPYGDLSSDDCLKGGSGTTDTGYHPTVLLAAATARCSRLSSMATASLVRR